jgi:glycosyltransferase involved in cell wall biosynthesis
VEQAGQPFFTVAIPLWNGVEFIKTSADSVLNQTFKDFELIIVDDASTDGSWEYVQSIKDPRVKVFRNEHNLGIVANWRSCLEKANGKWFKFLLHDDFLFPDALQILKNLIDKYPENFVIVTSGINFDDFEKVKYFLEIKPRELKDTDKYLKPIKQIIEARKRFNQTWAMPNSYTMLRDDYIELFSSSDYLDIEKKFGGTGHLVDYYILYGIALKYKTMIEMDFPTYAVRFHPTNFSRSYNQNLLYHLNGDKYVHYKLYKYKGIEHFFILRHAWRIYIHHLRSYKREILNLIFLRKLFQVMIFSFKHLLSPNKLPKIQ